MLRSKLQRLKQGGGKYPQFYSTASSGQWFFLAYDFEFESKWWLSTEFLQIFCSNSTVVQNREQPEPCVYVCLAWKTPIWHSKVTVKVKWKTFHLQTVGWPKQRRSQFGKAGVTKWTPERTSDEICWRFNFLLVKLNYPQLDWMRPLTKSSPTLTGHSWNFCTVLVSSLVINFECRHWSNAGEPIWTTANVQDHCQGTTTTRPEFAGFF